MTTHLPSALAIVALGALLGGCVANAPTGGPATTVAVESSADDCVVDTATVESGTVTFAVTSSADRVTEFYLLRDDGVSIVAELEDIAPGSTRDLTVNLEPGGYVTQCKPGMSGTGLGAADFTVTETR
jgi:iron uptake system component EfeO